MKPYLLTIVLVIVHNLLAYFVPGYGWFAMNVLVPMLLGIFSAWLCRP